MKVHYKKGKLLGLDGNVIFIVLITVVLDGLYLMINHPGSIDEVTSVAAPAYFAGLDWSDLCTLKLKWHGFGATIFILPFLLLFGKSNIYLLCLLECLLFRIILNMLTYVISERYFLLDKKKSAMIAMACNFGVLSANNGKRLSAMTEIPIALIMILIVYLLLWGMNKKKALSTILVTLLIVYTSTIHSRVLICAGTIIVTIVICRWKYKKWIINIPVAVAASIIGMWIIGNFDSLIKNTLYSFGGGEANFNNTTSDIFLNGTSKLQLLLDLNYIKLFGEEFLSLCSSYTYYTFGMIWVVTLIDFDYIIQCLRNKRKDKVDGIFLVALVGLISFWGMNVTFSLKSISLFSRDYYQILTYVRYAMPFAWFLVLAALAIIVSGNVNRKKVSIYAAVLSLLFGKFFLSVPIIRLEESGMGLNKSFFQSIFWNGEEVRQYFTKIYFFSMLALTITILAWRNSYKNFISCYIVFSMLCIISVFSYCIKREEDNNIKIDKCNEILQIIREERSDIPIYYYSRDNLFYMYLIFDNLDLNMRYAKGVENLDLDNGIYITNFKDKEVKAEFVLKLDNNGYVYTSNEGIYECISNQNKQGGNNGN